VFLIGPGGVGKTTSGELLAQRLKYNFVDLDREFCDRIENISIHIKRYGYTSYCLKNSELFFGLLPQCSENTIFVLSSGFLVHEGMNQLTQKHHEALRNKGITVRLLPSASLEESTAIVVGRQLRRGFGLQEDSEREKFQKRYLLYREMGDVRVYSAGNPKEIAELMEEELKNLL